MNKDFLKRLISSVFLIPLSFYFIFKGSWFFSFFLIICFLITIYEWHMMSKNKSYIVYGYLFIVFSFYSVYIIRNDLGDDSLFIFLFILITSISTDIGGYVFGKIFKGPKLTKISPKKTYSGVLGGYILSLIVVILFFNFSHFITNNIFTLSFSKIFLILIISSISQAGDLVISYFKRLSKIKDTGRLIPGHGGILDRIDGMIFAFPFYFLFNLFGLF
tara:strand:- start:262 stop:915 length:654 start_codon:yes stop_codon:yes gene_type:complete